MRQKPIREPILLKLQLNIYLRYFCYSPEDQIPSPGGHPGVHISVSLLLLQMPHCEQTYRFLPEESISSHIYILYSLTVLFALKHFGDKRTLKNETIP